MASGSRDLNAIARLALEQGDFEGAVRAYTDVITQDPGHAEAYYKRGNALNALGRREAALADYDRAIALDSGYAHAHCNRGTVLERLERWDEALLSYDRAIALDTGDWLAHYNRAWVLKQLRRYDEALADYDRAIELNRDYFEAYVNRGYVLQDLRRHEAAAASFARAIALNPRYPDALRAHGTSLLLLCRYEEAIGCFDRAIELQPADAEAHQARGFAQLFLKRFEAAIASYENAIALQPDFKFILSARLYAKAQICDWADQAGDIRRIVDGLVARRSVCQPFFALALLDAPDMHRLAAEVWVRETCPPDDALGPIPARPRAEKIRVGYFSADFRTHPVAALIAELFEIHDRSRFEITAFAFGPDANDDVRARLRRAFDRFVDVRLQSDVEVASLARQLEIDIAVDLVGFTEHGRPKIFALRAAPIQVNFLGYPGTSGAGYMDYMVADRQLIPAGQREHYSEKVLYMPDSYQVNDSHRRIAAEIPTRKDLQLPDGAFVFCCFNNNFKIRTETFAIWMSILSRVEHSVLWLLEDNPIAAGNLRREAANRGVDPARLVFAQRTSPAQHLSRQRVADLFLDTLPYNAHTTASDALWSGLPVLTLAGRSFAARVAASLLRALGLPELVCSTPAEYEAFAVRLGSEPGLLQEIREKLAGNRATQPLFDTARYARHLEAGFGRMYERHLAGSPPADIVVAD